MADFKLAREAIRVAGDFIQVADLLCPPEPGELDCYGDFSTLTAEDLKMTEPYSEAHYRIMPEGLALDPADSLHVYKYLRGEHGRAVEYGIGLCHVIGSCVDLYYVHDPLDPDIGKQFRIDDGVLSSHTGSAVQNIQACKSALGVIRALREAERLVLDPRN